jgi:hypothetical protein
MHAFTHSYLTLSVNKELRSMKAEHARLRSLMEEVSCVELLMTSEFHF